MHGFASNVATFAPPITAAGGGAPYGRFTTSSKILCDFENIKEKRRL